MTVVSSRRGLTGIAAAFLLAGCSIPAAEAPAGGPAATPVPAGGAANEWRFGTREHLALWYHGLSFVLPPVDTLPLPIYDPAEQGRALAAARRAGVSRTPIQAAADSIAHEFAGSSVYEQLQFVPLYFEDSEALFNAMRVWEQSGGNPQAAGSQQGAQAVALLSGIFDTPRLRTWVVRFARTLEAERTAYYGAYWREREAALKPVADAAGRDWAGLATSLAPLLRYLQVTGGEVLVTPSLGGEGRTVNTRGFTRSAVGDDTGENVVYALVHELMYSLVGEVVREQVAPARLRELGEDAVTSRAAARAGALVLERLAPTRAEAYRRFYLRAAGRSGTGDPAFRSAFPLPAELDDALPRAVNQALAGI